MALRGLDARVQMALCKVFLRIEDADIYASDAWKKAREFASADGCEMAMATPGVKLEVPLLLQNDEELSEWFLESVEWTNERLGMERQEQERGRKHQEQIQRVEAVKRGELSWVELGVPSPEDALKALIEGAGTRVNGHSITFADGVTWYTNPYGQDGVLGNEPDLEMMTAFLADMALGKDYGPVPY